MFNQNAIISCCWLSELVALKQDGLAGQLGLDCRLLGRLGYYFGILRKRAIANRFNQQLHENSCVQHRSAATFF